MTVQLLLAVLRGTLQCQQFSAKNNRKGYIGILRSDLGLNEKIESLNWIDIRRKGLELNFHLFFISTQSPNFVEEIKDNQGILLQSNWRLLGFNNIVIKGTQESSCNRGVDHLHSIGNEDSQHYTFLAIHMVSSLNSRFSTDKYVDYPFNDPRTYKYN